MKVTKTPDYRSRYTNHFQINVMLTDVRLCFGEYEPVLQTVGGTATVAVNQVPDVELHTALTLPLPLARELHAQLGRLLSQAVSATALTPVGP
jgi:hypothetical protein